MLPVCWCNIAVFCNKTTQAYSSQVGCWCILVVECTLLLPQCCHYEWGNCELSLSTKILRGRENMMDTKYAPVVLIERSSLNLPEVKCL